VRRLPSAIRGLFLVFTRTKASHPMVKEKKVQREAKKAPALSKKEKKAAKIAKRAK
jgi:hypothetical protein